MNRNATEISGLWRKAVVSVLLPSVQGACHTTNIISFTSQKTCICNMALPLDSRALAVPFRVYCTPRLRSRAAVTPSRRSTSTQTESPHSEFNTYYARLQSQKLYDTHIPTTPFQKAILMCGSAIGSFVAPERDSESTNHIPQ